MDLLQVDDLSLLVVLFGVRNALVTSTTTRTLTQVVWLAWSHLESKSLATGVRTVCGLCALPPEVAVRSSLHVFGKALSFVFYGAGLGCWQLRRRGCVCELFCLAEGRQTFLQTW